jgi:hypothetical protein
MPCMTTPHSSGPVAPAAASAPPDRDAAPPFRGRAILPHPGGYGADHRCASPLKPLRVCEPAFRGHEAS